MKLLRIFVGVLSLTLFTLHTKADVNKNISPQQTEQLVREITAAQNKASSRGATLDDVERLFAMYTTDFVYEHPGMNESYTREHLYTNHIRALNQGRYEKFDEAEYGNRIVNIMLGEKAAAVLRTTAKRGEAAPRLTVFEFNDGKVTRIREYWNY